MNNIYSFFSIFLKPFSLLWESLYCFRRFAYNYRLMSRSEFDIPIISIGNLSFGGTGKTPCTLWIANYLLEKKLNPLILMRGYKGSAENSSLCIDESSRKSLDVTQVGDEAALLANRLSKVPILVGKKRSSNLKYYFPELKPDVVLLDDGHQHIQLSRDLNIVLFDALMPLKKYQTAPMGYLREGLSALQDADAILFSRADQVSSKKIEDLKSLLLKHASKNVVFGEFRYIPVGFYNKEFKKVFNLEELKEKKVYAMSGIASPESFYNLLESLGLVLTQKYTYPDHHEYIAEDFSPLLEIAENNDTYVITTEKDMVKLKNLVNSERILYLEIQLDFLNGQNNIEKLLDSIL